MFKIRTLQRFALFFLPFLLMPTAALAASVKLDWNPPPVPNSTCGQISYVNIWRSDTTGGFAGQPAPFPPPGPPVKIASLQVPALGPVPITATDATVLNGKTYYYYISFYVNPGVCSGPNGVESTASNEAQAIVGSPAHVTTPTGLKTTVTN